MYKWLNLVQMCQKLRVDEDVLKVKYFTSLVFGQETQNRQLRYLQALNTTMPVFESRMGRFKSSRLKCRHTLCLFSGDRHYETSVEKRTDVNIAVEMAKDAYDNACDVQAVISGDSDLVPAVEMCKSKGKRVAVYVPVRPLGDDVEERRADEIKKAATTGVDLPYALVKACQFPAIVIDSKNHPIACPPKWMSVSPT